MGMLGISGRRRWLEEAAAAENRLGRPAMPRETDGAEGGTYAIVSFSRRPAGSMEPEPACKPDSVDRLRDPAVIPLGRRLPAGSSDLYPEAWSEPLASLFGLAPGGVYRASAVTGGSGELLPHRFTLAVALRRRRFVFCGTFPASRRAVVIGHPALWSPDFPPASLAGMPATARPAQAPDRL